MISSLSLRPKAPTLSPMFAALACLETLHPERFRQLNTQFRWLPAKWAVRKSKKPADFTNSEVQLLADSLKDLDLSPARHAEAEAFRQAETVSVPKASKSERKRPESAAEMLPLKDVISQAGIPKLKRLTLLFNHTDSHTFVTAYFKRVFKRQRKLQKACYVFVVAAERHLGTKVESLNKAFMQRGWTHLSENQMQLRLGFLNLDLTTTLKYVRDKLRAKLALK